MAGVMARAPRFTNSTISAMGRSLGDGFREGNEKILGRFTQTRTVTTRYRIVTEAKLTARKPDLEFCSNENKEIPSSWCHLPGQRAASSEGAHSVGHSRHL